MERTEPSHQYQPYYAVFAREVGAAPNYVYMAWIAQRWAEFRATHPTQPEGDAEHDAFAEWLAARANPLPPAIPHPEPAP